MRNEELATHAYNSSFFILHSSFFIPHSSFLIPHSFPRFKMRHFLPVLLLVAACSRPVAVTKPTPVTDPPGADGVKNATNPTNPNAADGAAIRNAAPDTSSRPAWLRQRIAAVLAERKPNPTIRIYRYRFQGQEVYWESAPCCDQYSTVFTLKGQVICHPDGGITGNGDGKCAGFEKEKTNERLVWQDPR